MLNLLYIIVVIGYVVIGFMTYCEYKTTYRDAPKYSFGKFIYLFVHGLLYIFIGLFVGVLGYLIYTI